MEMETGMLPNGLEHGGTMHREFALRPLTVEDMVEAAEDARAQRNEHYRGLLMLCRQLESLGSIPKSELKPALLMKLNATDFAVLNAASEAMHERLAFFREEPQEMAKGNARADAARVRI